MPVLPLDCHLPTQYTTHTITLQQWTNNKTNKSYKQLIYIYIYISHVNVTQTVPDISPLMPMHQYPLLVTMFGYDLARPELWPVDVQGALKFDPSMFKKTLKNGMQQLLVLVNRASQLYGLRSITEFSVFFLALRKFFKTFGLKYWKLSRCNYCFTRKFWNLFKFMQKYWNSVNFILKSVSIRYVHASVDV